MNLEGQSAPNVIELALHPHLARGDIPQLCADLAESVHGGQAATVICDVGRISEPTMVTVEALTRLSLTARRHGLSLWLCRTDRRLRSLLELVGLSGELPEKVPPLR